MNRCDRFSGKNPRTVVPPVTPVVMALGLGFESGRAGSFKPLRPRFVRIWRVQEAAQLTPRFVVDGLLVHERSHWTPTPIPDQPMEVNVNVWSSESVRFAGTFDDSVLPSRVDVTRLNIPDKPAGS